MKHRIFLLSFALFSMMTLSGCIGDLMAITCDFLPDSDHCSQAAAIQESNPDRCAKIKGEKFKDLGSNPPRDKCYLEIAENTGNYSVCEKIQGGAMSYSKEECILGTALKQGDAAGCKKLSGYPAAQAQCRDELCSITAVKSQDEEIDRVREALKSDPKNKELAKQLADLKAEKDERYEQMSGPERGQYFKEKREAILADVEDGDVQSAITKAYTNYRNSNPDAKIDNLLDRLNQIKTEQEMIKRADEEANVLVDTVKEQLQSYVDEAQDAVLDSAKEKATDWIEKKGSENLKWTLKNLEWAKEKYEKGSEQYEALNAKYEKLKKAYDEVMGTYKKIDEFNTMVADGKITEGQAKVLKGAVLLDKSLEYATGYVPVFGSTISTVSKETFGVAIELAKKRAQRTNSLQKCIDDPEHCDPNGITAY